MCVSCDQWVTRNWGGTTTTTLPHGKKVVMVTWKGSDLWILLRDTKPGESPERLELLESSVVGLLQGKVILIEQ